MGGGDLNLKKSWHPSTLRNIERVWKAEQKHEVERQKIEQLQKELAAERAREEIQTYAEDQGVVKKKDQRLDWMYQGPAAFVDREDYLLGRKIDKTLEMLQMQESGKEPSKREEEQSRSIFHPEASASDVTVDLQNKIKEDPLFAIMKREKEARKDLLNNPVRMKQIQSMLKQSLSKKDRTKKSKKKSKKAKYDVSDSSSDSDAVSEEKVEKHHSKEKKRNYKRRDESSHHSRDHSNDSYERKRKKHRSPDYEAHNVDKYNYVSKHRSEPERSRKAESTPYTRKTEYRDRHSESEKYRREGGRSQNRQTEERPNGKRKLSAAEKERLREEMMSNAKWREEQRSTNVKRYAAESEKEDKIGKGRASDFIIPMLAKAAANGTVEDRVRQKIFTIQRKKSDMSSHFARR